MRSNNNDTCVTQAPDLCDCVAAAGEHALQRGVQHCGDQSNRNKKFKSAGSVVDMWDKIGLINLKVEQSYNNQARGGNFLLGQPLLFSLQYCFLYASSVHFHLMLLGATSIFVNSDHS